MGGGKWEPAQTAAKHCQCVQKTSGAVVLFIWLLFLYFVLFYASSNSKAAASLTYHNWLLLSYPVTHLDKNSSENALYFSGMLEKRHGKSVWSSVGAQACSQSTERWKCNGIDLCISRLHRAEHLKVAQRRGRADWLFSREWGKNAK